MYINDEINCCAVKELAEISLCNSPHNVLLRFCQILSGSRYLGQQPYLMTPAAFYLFTGVIECSGNEYLECECGDEDCCCLSEDEDYLPPETLTYGPAFADYIRQNGLGKLVETDGEWNRVNHPTHRVKVWVWSPDEDALRAWWKQHQPKPVETSEKVA